MILKTAARHRMWLLGTVLLVLAATLAAYYWVPRRYTASASVWLDHRLGRSDTTQGKVSGPADGTAPRNTEMRFLTSSDIAARVVDQLGLADIRGFGQPVGTAPVPRDQARQRAITAVLDGVNVQAHGTSYTVVASYTGTDPVMATGIINQLVDQYVAYRRDNGANANALNQLRRTTESAHDEMIRADAAVAAYRAAASIMGSDNDVEPLRREIATLHAQLAQAPNPATATSTSDAKNDTKSASLRDLHEQLSQLTANRAELQKLYGPRHPEIIAINGRIADVNSEITSETTRLGKLVAVTRAASNRVNTQAEANKKLDAQRARLDDAANRARDRYASRLRDLRQAMAARPDPSGAYIISRAAVPLAPDSPDPWRFALAGLLLALLASTAVVGAAELLTPGFRSKRAAEQKLGVPVIGMVPDISEVPGAQDAKIAPANLILSHNWANFGAAFTNIRLGLGIGRDPESPRCVAVSSAVAEEGKTTVSISLARSAALAGLRVLLIDCDVRHPAASHLIAPNANAGLVDVLKGSSQLDRAVTQDTVSGAWFLGAKAGEAPVNGLVDSDAMMKLLDQAEEVYDLVVLDTAPVLALAETRTLAGFSHSVLLVARWRRTPVAATRLALSYLNEAAPQLTMLALTRVGK